MTIRAWPVSPARRPAEKSGAGQDSEPASPCGLSPHRSVARASQSASLHKI